MSSGPNLIYNKIFVLLSIVTGDKQIYIITHAFMQILPQEMIEMQFFQHGID